MSDPQDRLADLTPEQKRALLAEMLKERAGAQKRISPPSDGQRALWFTHQLAPQSYAYHVSFSVRVRSSVNLVHLQRAIQAVVNRHATLRTTYFVENDTLVQQVHHFQEADFRQISATGWSDAQLYEQVLEADHHPFNLESGPIIRWRLFTRETEDHIFLITAHHIAIDAWSLWIVLEDLRQALEMLARGESINLPPEPALYMDWARWQSEMLAGEEGERLRTYWQEQLSGELPLLKLPYDFPHPLIPTFAGDSIAFILNADQTRRFKALAQSEGVTLYMAMLAAYQVLLYRYSGQEEILVGTPTSGRSEITYNGTVGYFINPVTLRGDLSGSPSFREFLSRTRQVVLGALRSQDYPFIRLVEQLKIHPEPGRSAVFQTLFNLHSLARTHEIADLVSQRGETGVVSFGGLLLERYFFPQEEGQFELALETIEAGDVLACTFRYQTDLFRRETVEQICGAFQILIEAILQNPAAPISELAILSAPERHKLLFDWNQTAADYPRAALAQQLFEAQVERTSDAIALVFEDQSLSYRELNRRANQLAHALRAVGVGPEERVGIFLERSPEMVIALLAVLKSGGAYVPMDPIYPPQRIQAMIEDSQMRVLVTQQMLVDSLPEHSAKVLVLDDSRALLAAQPDDNPVALTDSAALAYVIFTSGSTGRPKGVQIPHRALVNFLCAMQREPGIQPADVLGAVTTLSFDIAGLEIFLPLVGGARVVILGNDTATDGVSLAEALERYGVTILQATPITWRLLIETGWQGRPTLKMLCGGEPLDLPLARRLLQLGGQLWNMYGPTETTIWSTLARVTAADTLISIGRPIANTQTYVLDEHLQPVAVGVTGALCIGGDGLSRGYLNRPDLTEAAFKPDPFLPGGRIYHTGDLARYLPDGRIEHLGRGDTQVKIRGFRIELGEIEALLNQHPALRQAVVIVREDTPGDKRLVAYFTSDAAPTARELSKFLREKLPAYMIPAAYVVLDAFPLTPNGKVNRKALPAPTQTSVETLKTVQPPTTPTEQLMVDVWKDVLQVDQVGIFDNFFDLGGHSLLAMRSVVHIQEKTGHRIEPAYMRFETLAQLASRVDQALRAA